MSLLALELQAEVDRFIYRRLRGGDALAHFRNSSWRADLDPESRSRYQNAHASALRYCRRLMRRFPERRDVPEMLRELRGFYRASPQAKLRTASGAS